MLKTFKDQYNKIYGRTFSNTRTYEIIIDFRVRIIPKKKVTFDHRANFYDISGGNRKLLRSINTIFFEPIIKSIIGRSAKQINVTQGCG